MKKFKKFVIITSRAIFAVVAVIGLILTVASIAYFFYGLFTHPYIDPIAGFKTYGSDAWPEGIIWWFIADGACLILIIGGLGYSKFQDLCEKYKY